MHAKSSQSCPALCNPMDCSPLDSSVHGILQIRLACIARPSFRGHGVKPTSSYVSCTGRCVLYHLHHLGNPLSTLGTSKQVNVHSLNFKCLSFLFLLIREACNYGKKLNKIHTHHLLHSDVCFYNVVKPCF